MMMDVVTEEFIKKRGPEQYRDAIADILDLCQAKGLNLTETYIVICGAKKSMEG